MKYYIGCSGWSYTSWKGPFYPPNLENPTDPIYFYKWDKREVAKLIAQSDEPCMNFYIGIASRKGQGGGSPARDILTVKSKQDFLEGSFDDLIILNKSGLMVTEESTLYLVEKAKKKLEDGAVEKVASQEAAVSNQ